MSAISSIDGTWSSARSVLRGRGSSSAPATTASNKAPTPSSSAVIGLLPDRPGNMTEHRLERDEPFHTSHRQGEQVAGRQEGRSQHWGARNDFASPDDNSHRVFEGRRR